MKKTICLTLSVLLLCALLAACSQPASTSSSSPVPSLSVASSLPPSSQSEPTAEVNLAVSALEYGGKTITLGMTKQEVDAILGESGEQVTEGNLPSGITGFSYLPDEEDNKLNLVFEMKKLISFLVDRKDITGYRGITIGFSGADFSAAYPEIAVATPEEGMFFVFLTEEVVLATIDPAEEEFADLAYDFVMMYKFDDEGKIEGIGLIPKEYTSALIQSK